VKLIRELFKQRRFQLMLIGLVALAVVLGILVVPVEQAGGGKLIRSVDDGLWWAVTTVTGVGYGDVYPMTGGGRVVGAILEIVGVLTFGLLVAVTAVAMRQQQERWYWKRLFERLEHIEERIKRIEKHEEFKIKDGI
jgi:voltage-gated potassium channel